MISDEMKTALVCGGKDWVLCGFCQKHWFATDKLDGRDTGLVKKFETHAKHCGTYNGDSVPFGVIRFDHKNIEVPVICDCEFLQRYETEIMINQDLIINYLKQLAQTEILIGRKKLTELEALTSHNERFKKQ